MGAGMQRNFASPYRGRGGLQVVGPISSWRVLIRPWCRHERLVIEEVIHPRFSAQRKCARCGKDFGISSV